MPVRTSRRIGPDRGLSVLRGSRVARYSFPGFSRLKPTEYAHVR